MTKTGNYQLNQWEPTDKFSRVDFNSDNAAIDAALANKAEKSAVTAVETALANYQTSNDAAMANAYTESNPAATCVRVLTTSMAAGDVVYTFTKEPKFVIVHGVYDTVIIPSGRAAFLYDNVKYTSDYLVTLRLTGTTLILVTRTDTSAASELYIAAFY